MATEVDDCPQESWKTTPCPQNMPEDQGDCLKVKNKMARHPVNVRYPPPGINCTTHTAGCFAARPAWLRPWQVHDLECRIPLEARPVMQSAGPKKYNRVHGIGIDGVTIQVNPRTAPRAP